MATKGTWAPLGTWMDESKQLPAPFTSVITHSTLAVDGVVMVTVPVGVPTPGATALTEPTENLSVWPDTRDVEPDEEVTVKLLIWLAAWPTVNDSEPMDAAYQASPG